MPQKNDIRSTSPDKAERQRWLAVLARATAQELAAVIERLGGEPAHTILKAPESGAVMIEGRAGGTGRRFNLGEATMTRCFVRLADGTVGASFALGTDRVKARHAALIDALLQNRDHGAPLFQHEVAPLAARQQAARDLASRKAAATKVDFFTLVRGEG